MPISTSLLWYCLFLDEVPFFGRGPPAPINETLWFWICKQLETILSFSKKFLEVTRKTYKNESSTKTANIPFSFHLPKGQHYESFQAIENDREYANEYNNFAKCWCRKPSCLGSNAKTFSRRVRPNESSECFRHGAALPNLYPP